jgi:hypothetical protein
MGEYLSQRLFDLLKVNDSMNGLHIRYGMLN